MSPLSMILLSPVKKTTCLNQERNMDCFTSENGIKVL